MKNKSDSIFNEKLQLVALSKVCNILNRSSDGYLKSEFVGPHEGAVIVSPHNIVNNQIQFDDVSYYSWDGYNERPAAQLHVGQILVCKYAQKGSVFKSAVIEALPEPAIANPSLLQLCDVQCDSHYLQLVLSSEEIQRELARNAKGMSMPSITCSVLMNLTIPLPSVSQQKKICDVFLNYREKVERLKSNLAREIENRDKEYNYYLSQALFTNHPGE